MTPAERDKLIDELLDGLISAADFRRLEDELDSSDESRRAYYDRLNLHTLLQAEMETRAEPPTLVNQSVWSLHRKWLIGFAAAAVLMLTAGLGWWVGHQKTLTNAGVRSGDSDQPMLHVDESVDDPISDLTHEQTDNGVAVLTHAVDVVWVDGNGPGPNAILSTGKLGMNSGVVQLELYNGVKLIVQGPADLDIVSVARVICREGKLRSIVPPNATDFSVLTPKFELVDLGTEFAVEVASDGRSGVHVFDGEVELYLPDGKREPGHKQVLGVGEAMAWSTEGTKTSGAAAPETFTSFEALRIREQSASNQRFGNWQQSSDTLRSDSRVVARYDFQSDGATLIDSSETKAHGTIVGCEWTSGRWPKKRALEFKRPGDRVRIDVPGEFDSLTVSASVRVDALPSRRQSLLLTDGYEVSRLHWQIGPEGELRFSSRMPPQGRRKNASYASPTVFTPRQIGAWNCVCSTYDRATQTATHWFNGKRVFTKSLVVDQPIRIGLAEIGNWGVPCEPVRQPIRNFIGRMDELTIWNVALDEHEIVDLYNTSRPRWCVLARTSSDQRTCQAVCSGSGSG